MNFIKLFKLIIALFFLGFFNSKAQPTSPQLYNFGGSDQLCFDNSRINTNAPVFRVSATYSAVSFGYFQIEVNTSSSFNGGTSYKQSFQGNYATNNQYNLTFNNSTPSFTPVSGTVYYVRIRASANNFTWSSWSSQQFSFTFDNTVTLTDWFQSVQKQFQDAGFSATNLQANAYNIQFVSGSSGNNPFNDPSFESANSNCSSLGWNLEGHCPNPHIGYCNTQFYCRQHYGVTNGNVSVKLDDETNWDSYNYRLWCNNLPVGDNADMSQTVNLTGVSAISLDYTFEDNGGPTGYSCTNSPNITVQLQLMVDDSIINYVQNIATNPPGTTTRTSAQKLTAITNFTGSHLVTIRLYIAAKVNSGSSYPGYYIDNVQTIVYPTTGVYISSPINLQSFNGAIYWNKLKWNQSIAINSSISFTIQGSTDNGANWNDIPGLTNISSGANGDISQDISLGGTNNYSMIRLKMTMTEASGGPSPSLNNWTVNAYICNPPALQPASSQKTACPGTSLTLSANSQGGYNCKGNWTYEWSDGGKYWDGTGFNLSGENYSQDYRNIGITDFNASTTYTVYVKCDSIPACNSQGAVNVILISKPVISNVLKDTVTCSGKPISFYVNTSGNSAFIYQWEKNDIIIPGATQSIYNLLHSGVTDSGYYKCRVSDICGIDSTNEAMLIVKDTLQLTLGPAGGTRCIGDTVILSVSFKGSPPFNYQWKKNDIPISNATNDNYILQNINEYDAGIYSCSVNNICGDISATTVLDVGNKPKIITSPIVQQKCSGDNILYSISVAGTGPFVYHWEKDNIIIPGATSYIYKHSDINVPDSGHYICSVSNQCGGTIADVAHLIVFPTPKVNLGKDTTITTNDSLLLRAGSGFSSYYWNNGSFDSVYKINPSASDTGIFTISVRVINKFGCPNSDTIKIKIINPVYLYSLNGNITYDNAASLPMSNTTLYLYKKTDNIDILIDSVNTASDGSYTFIKVADGTYFFKIKTKKKWGGSNPVDALKINRYFIGAYNFKDNIMKKAADVNGDGRINPLDALLVNRRFINSVKSFSVGNWYFDINQFIIKGSDFKYDFKSICFGDVDGSY